MAVGRQRKAGAPAGLGDRELATVGGVFGCYDAGYPGSKAQSGVRLYLCVSERGLKAKVRILRAEP